MAFDYNSRTKWEKEKWEGWQEAHRQQIDSLPEEQKALYEEVRQFSNYPGCGFPVIARWTREHFPKAADLARNNEMSVKGIVINAFTEPFVVPREMFDVIENM